MQEAFNRSHSSLRSSIEGSFGILKKRWKILGGMPKYSVETQHDIIIATFALHNYIRNNDREDKVFTTFEQHPDYMGCDELHDVRRSVTNNDNISSGTSNEMKQIRNDIATSESVLGSCEWSLFLVRWFLTGLWICGLQVFGSDLWKFTVNVYVMFQNRLRNEIRGHIQEYGNHRRSASTSSQSISCLYHEPFSGNAIYQFLVC
nr:hypothetical protein [Tanacetum cinerariifolium]